MGSSIEEGERGRAVLKWRGSWNVQAKGETGSKGRQWKKHRSRVGC